jgi:hypothetical protein
METRKLVVVLASLVVVLTATVVVLAVGRSGSGSATRVGSGHAVSVVHKTGPFSAVQISGAANAVVRVGAKTTVVVRGDDNIVPLVRAEVSGGTLVISEHGSYTTSRPLTVTVHTPTLTAVRLSGAGNVAAYGIGAPTFVASLDGAGRFDLRGTAQSLTLNLAGAGVLDARNLPARSVRANVSGTGTIRVTARRLLDARVSGTGSIVYSGRPARLLTHISGTGTITGA